MKKIRIKHIIISIVVIYGCLFIHQFYTGHHTVINSISKNYLFLFKDSVVSKIDTPISYSCVSNQDILNGYLYNDDKYCIKIWEFNDLKKYSLQDLFINSQSTIKKSEFSWEETLNSKSFLPISIKYLYKIDGMILNLGENTKIIKELQGKNYKGFYGLVDKMSICNKKGEPQIYLNFAKSQTPTVLLLYKSHNSFYLIMVNPNNELYKNIKIDENIIKILKLD
jgi:hypothetical protein